MKKRNEKAKAPVDPLVAEWKARQNAVRAFGPWLEAVQKEKREKEKREKEKKNGEGDDGSRKK